MFGFLFRKTIFDSWDHILGLFLSNIVYILFFAFGILVVYMNSTGDIDTFLTVILMIVMMLGISMYTVGMTTFAYHVNHRAQKGKTLEGIVEHITTHIPHIIVHALITTVIIVNIVFAIPFYISMEGLMGNVLTIVCALLSIFIVFNLKYYLPLCYLRPKEGVVDIIKYSFAYALDNKKITLQLLLRSGLDIVLSIPTVGLAPGFTGIQISDMCAAELLNQRYLMAEEKDVFKEEIRWDDVLEIMGQKNYAKRKFISLLFPGR